MRKRIKKGVLLLLAAVLLLSAAGCAVPQGETGRTPANASQNREDPSAVEHQWHDGVCTVCGEVCTHEWKNGVCTVCGVKCRHSWEGGVCTVCGVACAHLRHYKKTLVCTTCGEAVEHNFVNGACSRCDLEPTLVTTPENYPEEVFAEREEHGSVETYHFALNEGEILPGARGDRSREDIKNREMVVYTPYDYDPAQRYNVLIVAPGAGHDAHQWMEKPNRVSAIHSRIKGCDLLDGMIAAGYTEPLIVAVVEYYLFGSPAEISVGYARDLRERVLPFLAANYGTYASIDEDGKLILAPEHFAFAGASFGAMIGWQMLPDCTDLFSYWGFFSGGFQNDEELAARINEGVSAEHPIHYLYAGDGMLLETWTSYRNRINWIGENCGCLEEGKNLRFVVVEKTEHDYASWNIALHNCLQLFFKTRYVPETAVK